MTIISDSTGEEVLPMTQELVKTVCDAEEEARQNILFAQQKARVAVAEEERYGQEKIAASVARAQDEIVHLIRASDQKATEQAMELASKTANRQAALRARAERRLDDAVKLIVERIVND